MKFSVLIFLTILFLSACRSSPETVVQPRLKIDPAATGTIHGLVLFKGAPPEPTKIPLASFTQCANPKGYDDDVRIRDGKVQNAFVYLKEGTEVYEIPPASGEVVIDQRVCLYTPRVVGLQISQTLVVKNSDPFLHNVHALPKFSSSFNVGMAKGAADIRRTFEKPEIMVPIRCDVHPWMRAHVGVLPHPYFAVTGPDGVFELRNVPPGVYTIEAWHERLGMQTSRIKINQKEEKEIEIVFHGPM